MKATAYTAIIGAYDTLKKQPRTGDEFVAYFSGKARRASPWKIVKSQLDLGRNVLTAKWYKMMPHRLFPGSDYTLWMDGSVKMTAGLGIVELAERYMKDADILLFKHHKRTCLYDEAIEVISQKLDKNTIVYEQVFDYTRDGYPVNNGLVEATVLLRRNNKAVNEFNELWWQEVNRYSVRDQISFNYLAQKTGIKIAYFPGTIGDNANELFRKYPHKGRPKILDTRFVKQAAVLIDRAEGRIGSAIRKKTPNVYSFLKKYHR